MNQVIVNFNNEYLINRYCLTSKYNSLNFKKDICKLYNTAITHHKLSGIFRVNISFVGQEKIKRLNNTYRQINKVTDVLSFPLVNDFSQLEEERDPNGIVDLGDIIVNTKKAYSQSIEYGHSLQRELCFLCVHGLLHLLGYDHITKEQEKEMFDMQNMLLNSFNIRRG